MADKRLVFAHDVKELLNGLESLPWEEEVGYLVDALPTPDDVEVVVHCGECAIRYTELCALYAGQMNGKDYFIQQGDDFFCKKGRR